MTNIYGNDLARARCVTGHFIIKAIKNAQAQKRMTDLFPTLVVGIRRARGIRAVRRRNNGCTVRVMKARQATAIFLGNENRARCLKFIAHVEVTKKWAA